MGSRIEVTIAPDGSVIEVACTPCAERDAAKALAGIEEWVSCLVRWHPPIVDPDEARLQATRELVRLGTALETERAL